jgi:hypothetical protein
MSTPHPNGTLTGLLLAGALALGVPPDAALAQGGVYAYPNAGQNSQQQAKDSSECQQWATGQTGFRPGEPLYVESGGYSAPPPSSSRGVFGRRAYGQGGGVGDAGKGAAMGAIGGAIAGDAGKGAAIGAVSGLFIGGIKRSNQQAQYDEWQRQQAHQQQQQEQSARAQYQQRQEAWNRAFGACMHARNYTVQ